MLTIEQNLFLSEVLENGDRNAARNKQQISDLTFMEWLTDIEFKIVLEKYEHYYFDNLIVKIGHLGLTKLKKVLEEGYTTAIRSTEEYYDPRHSQTVQASKETIKYVEISERAIKTAIQLYIAAKAEKDVLNNIAELASRGLLPANSEAIIASHMAEYQQRVKDALRGDFEAAGINEEILSQIQQLVINGS